MEACRDQELVIAPNSFAASISPSNTTHEAHDNSHTSGSTPFHIEVIGEIIMQFVDNTTLSAASPFSGSDELVHTCHTPPVPLYPPQDHCGWQHIIGHPIQWPPRPADPYKDAALLDKAEALAEDAFRKVSPFNGNVSLSDKLQAEEEMEQAQQLRGEVAPDLNASQKQTLDSLSSEEQDAVNSAISPQGGFLNNIFGAFKEMAEMTDGEAKSRQLDNSILGFPPAPPFPFPIQPLI
jgi:hypothetical protein